MASQIKLIDYKIPILQRGVKRSFDSIPSMDFMMESKKYRVIRKKSFLKTLLIARTEQELAAYLLSVNLCSLVLFEGNVYGTGKFHSDGKTLSINCLSSANPDDRITVTLKHVRDKTLILDEDDARTAIVCLLNNMAMIRDRNEYAVDISTETIIKLFRYTFLIQPKRVVKNELNRLKQRKFIRILENGNDKPSLVSLINDETPWENDDITKLHLGDPQL